MNKLNELLNELNAIVKETQDLNKSEIRQYILGLIEQMENELLD